MTSNAAQTRLRRSDTVSHMGTLARRLSVLISCCLAALMFGPGTPYAREAGVKPVLTADGLDPVRLGTTVADAERVLRAKLARLSRAAKGFATEPEASESCWVWRRRDGRDPGITYMTERGSIVRIDVAGEAGGGSPMTARGIGIGSTEADVARAYGPDLQVEPHPIAQGTTWAVIRRHGRNGIRVEIRDGKVVAMFAARGGALNYPEGCS